MTRVACLAVGAIASIVVAAGARPASAMPVGSASISTTVAAPVTASGLSLFPKPSQATQSHGAIALSVFGFEQKSASGFSAPETSYYDTGADASGLAANRIFDLPASLLGVADTRADSLVTDTVFGVVSTDSENAGADGAPVAFAAVTSITESSAIAKPLTVASSAAVGLKFKLLGGEHVIAFDDVSAQTASGPGYQTSSPFFFGGTSSAPGTAMFGLDRTFQSLGPSASDSGSLLAIGSGDAFTTPAFGPANSFNAGPSAGGAYPSSAQGTSVQLNFPLTLGNVDARLSLSGREMHDMRPTLIAPGNVSLSAPSSMGGRYQEFGGGVTIGVPVFKHKAQVSLNGVVDRLVNVDKSQYGYAAQQQPLSLNPFLPAANNVLTQANPTLTLDPNYVNLRRYVGAYAVAVPISTVLTANMQYVDQRYGGDAVNALAQDLNVGTRSATIGVLYKIPNTNASIDLNFNQYKFLDDLTPANNFVKNRQNLFFTVKF